MTGGDRGRGSRLILAAVFLIGLVILAWLVFNPSDAAPSTAISDTRTWLFHHGFHRSWTGGHFGYAIGFVFNVAMFVPLGVVGGLLWPRISVRTWALIALVTSATIETIQLLFLPGRTWSISDIAANTLGGLLGGLLAHTVGREGRRV